MYLLLDTDIVWSRQTTDQTRVQTQNVHNSWSNRWIELKFLQEFLEVVFLGEALKSLRDVNGVWSGQTTDRTRVSAQDVHNFWFDRWIVLGFLQEFSEAVFLGIAMKSLLDGRNVLLALTTNQTKVPAQKVNNLTPPASGWATPRTTKEYRLKRSINLNLIVGSCLNFYRSFNSLVSLSSQWNRHETSMVSGRARQPTRPEYRLKRSITLDLTVGSSSNFFRSFRRFFS